jgi:hypothetical protein
MPKFIVDVKERQILEGQVTYVTSSHIVEASTENDARTFFFARKFPNEVIQSVRLYEDNKKKPNKLVKH